MSEFKTVRGMRDFLPQDARTLRYVEAKTREVAELYGYREIVTPVVESYELLTAKAGDEIRSRMFTFKDLGKRQVALRPEFTASIARIVATTLRNEPKPFRLFCAGSVYRYDEPQKGRYREFWQSDYEIVGSNSAEADVEIILLTHRLMRAVGLWRFAFKIGHIGVLRGILSQEGLDEKVQNSVMQLMDKKRYEDAFDLLTDGGISKRAADVLRSLIEIKGNSPFETVEKIEACVKGYEKSAEAAANLRKILRLVVDSGCNIDITVDAGFARGLEYYTGLIFEVYVPEMGTALGGGGRYDRLIELFGGEPTPATGVAHGLDRIMLALQGERADTQTLKRAVTIIPLKEELRSEALRISEMLRNAGTPVEIEVMGRKIAKALEDADRRGVSHVVIVGERELKENAVVVRNLAKREQVVVKIEKLAKALMD